LLAACENEGGVAITAAQYFIDVGHNAYLGETKFDLFLIKNAFGYCYIYIVIGYTYCFDAKAEVG
jgi:hypothetical protein